MKTIIGILIFFVVFLSCNNTSSSLPDDTSQNIQLPEFMHLKGYIDNKYPITLDINIYQNSVSGIMYYDKVGKYIDIQGTINNNEIIMDGRAPDGKIYDHFNGKITEYSIYGTWSNPTNNISYPFELKNTNKNCVLVKKVNYAIKDSALNNDHYEDFIYNFEGVYPVATPIKHYEKEILKKIFEFDKDPAYFEEYIKKQGNTTYQDWKDFITTSDEEYLIYEQDYQTTVTVSYNQNCLFSLVIDSYIYMGGAHGLYSTDAYNFDVKEGKLLHYKDIIKDTIAFLNNLIIPELEQYFLKEFEQPLDDFLLVDRSEIELPSTWMISDNKKFIFVYALYSIVPYVYGTPKLEISYQRIKPYLQDWFIKRLEE